MKHRHIGDPMKLCARCIPEIAAELARARFWRWALVIFIFAVTGLVLAAFLAFVRASGIR